MINITPDKYRSTPDPQTNQNTISVTIEQQFGSDAIAMSSPIDTKIVHTAITDVHITQIALFSSILNVILRRLNSPLKYTII